jgi:hypothetical protein
LACHNIGELHWEPHKRLVGPDEVVRELLWRFAEEGRLDDVRIVDSLRRLACDVDNPVPCELEDLLSLGIQVRGEIAAAAAERPGLTLRGDAAHDLRTEARSLIAIHSRTLRADREARACFRWNAGSEVERDGRGLPRAREGHLRRWLGQRADAVRGEYGFGLRVPQTERGVVDTGPGR